MSAGSTPDKEHCLREVERAMLFIADAQRRAEKIADELESADAEDRYVNALRTAAGALRAEHNRLLNSTHFTVPDEPIADFPEIEERRKDSDQQRMAI